MELSGGVIEWGGVGADGGAARAALHPSAFAFGRGRAVGRAGGCVGLPISQREKGEEGGRM